MIVTAKHLGRGQRCLARPHQGLGLLTLLLAVCGGLSGCSDHRPIDGRTPGEIDIVGPSRRGGLDGLVDVGGGRKIYVRCTGTGSPTLILEGGDEDTGSSYAYAEADLAAVTRTCVYDRANLGSSDPDPGPRGLGELVADFEGVLKAANIPGPYVLVGTSGGGYISEGYAVSIPSRSPGSSSSKCPLRSGIRPRKSWLTHAGTRR